MKVEIARRTGASLFRGMAIPEAFPEVGETLRRVAERGPARNGARPAAVQPHRPQCALTIDVEDWYQSSVDLDAPITARVVRNMERVRAVLDGCGVKATFFVQGRVAETFPRMLQELLAEGHEIQSHGYSHRPLYQMDRRALRTELELARKTIEDACGVRVTAFRAPDFSILKDNLWALDVLAENGFEVDSSIFPMAMKRYGIGGWSIEPERITLPNGARILEVPVAVWTGVNLRAPVAGGGYFRLLPQGLLETALRSIVAQRRPAILYCHPYEFNPEELDDYRAQVSPLFRAYQGLGRRSFVGRVRHLLTALPFGRFDDVIRRWEEA
jgi:polysaccharide deacetylase family protein (PEP-CTERM system associated)